MLQLEYKLILVGKYCIAGCIILLLCQLLNHGQCTPIFKCANLWFHIHVQLFLTLNANTINSIHVYENFPQINYN